MSTFFYATFSVQWYNKFMKSLVINDKSFKIVWGSLAYLKSACALMDSIKEDFKSRNIDIYQDGYPNYEIIENDLKNGENTLLLIDENDNVYAQIVSTPNELHTMFSDEEVLKILHHYNLPDKPYVGLCRLFVDKSLRSNGVGTFLIKQMEEKYKGQNFIFFVHLTNHNALKLYKQLGFKNLGIYNYPFGEFYTFVK